MKYVKLFFSMLKSNWVLKGAAIIFAVLIWSYVMSETNPYYSITVNDVPIRIENAQIIEQNGYAIIGGIEGLDTNVDVTIEVRRSDYQKVTKESIIPVLDLSMISGKGTYQVPITVATQYGNVKTMIKPYVEVSIDEKISRTIPVTYALSGGDLNKYYYREPVLDSNTIIISGARVDIEKAEKGVATINLDGITSDFKKSIPVDVYDAQGNQLNNVYIKDTFPSVVVNMQVLPKKSVYINALSSIAGAELLPKGYEVKGVTATPPNVEIVGPQDVLDKINEAYLETIHIYRTDADFTVSAKVKDIDGVEIVKNGEVTVVVHIGKIGS